MSFQKLCTILGSLVHISEDSSEKRTLVKDCLTLGEGGEETF